MLITVLQYNLRLVVAAAKPALLLLRQAQQEGLLCKH